jgi:hypothetical protein
MQKFLQNKVIASIEACLACDGNRPNCEDTLNAIIDSMPLHRSGEELRPIVPRDIQTMNFCMDAIARVAACRANRQQA